MYENKTSSTTYSLIKAISVMSTLLLVTESVGRAMSTILSGSLSNCKVHTTINAHNTPAT